MTKKIKIVAVMSVIFMLVGCSTISKEETQLKKQLKEYGNEIFNNNEWKTAVIAPGTYTITLSDLKNKLDKDITQFTKAKCDMKKTNIQVIVKESKANGKKANKEIKYNLDCK